MVYVLLIIGLALIYFSLKSGKTSAGVKNFSTVLQSNINTNELEKVTRELKDLSDRIENIEASLLLINEKLHFNSALDNTFDTNGNINSAETINQRPDTILNNEQLKVAETASQLNDTKTINDTLYKMYDEGRSLDEISSITRVGKGEILLRLGLRKQNQ